MKVAPFQLVSGATIGVGFVSSVVDLQQVWIYSLQASWTGAPIGEFKLQASNDLSPLFTAQDTPFVAPTHWTTIAGTVASTTIINSASFMWNVDSPSYRWVRLVYVASTATGVLTVNALTKGY